jgi:hypothetical protein
MKTILSLLLVVALVSCKKANTSPTNNSNSSTTNNTTSKTYSVKYFCECSSQAWVSYVNEYGAQVQDKFTGTWKYEFNGKSGNIVSLAIGTDNDTKIIGQIYVNGQIFKQGTSISSLSMAGVLTD